MITHNMLAGAIFRDDLLDAWCGGFCNSELSCRKCCDRMVTEYEDSIRADQMRVFKEWFRGSKYCECFAGIIDSVIAAFEKEGKEGEQIE